MSHGRSCSQLMSSARRLVVVNVLAATILAFAFTFQSAAPASASIGWCRSDPVVVLDLAVADVFTSAKLSDLPKITGPTQVVIVIPSTVKTAIGIPTLGFGYGEQVTFERSNGLKATLSRIELRVKVYVPSTDSTTPIRVEFAPRVLGILSPTSAQGFANSWITFHATL
jgi:hypothetical protein